MKPTGINLNDVKNANRAAVLYLLNREGTLSRKDISERLGLTPAAVTKITRELLSWGQIIEIGEAEENQKAGRKKILLSLNSDGIFALGISLEADFCTYGVFKISGERVLSEKIKFDHEIPPEEFLLRISDRVNAVVEKSGVSREKIIGAGVGTVGSVNENGETVGKYGLWHSGVNIKSVLENALGVNVRVENNIKAFVLAQTVFAGENEDKNKLFIKWGPGVGSAIVIDGEVFSSNGNSEAEIGHYIVHPNGTPCRCGRRGCLETHVSKSAILGRIRQSYSKENTPRLYKMTDGNAENITFDMIFDPNIRLDKSVREIIDRRINRMARAVVNAATLFDPDGVMLFGNMFTDKTVEKFIAYCKGYYEEYSENFISVAPLQDKADYIGPVALVVKYMFLK